MRSTKDSRLRQRARDGSYDAISKLVRKDPSAFRASFTGQALLEAKDLLAQASKRRSLDAATQLAVDRAEQFLEDLAEAVRFVPSLRTQAIVERCQALIYHLARARPLIVETPRQDRGKGAVLEALARKTKLPKEVVAVFLRRPRTGAKTLAREITGREFGITAEQVRTLQKKYGRRYPIRPVFIAMRSTRKRK